MIIEQRKEHIYSLLKGIVEEKVLLFIEEFLQNVLTQPKTFLYAKPLKAKVNIKDLKTKQNYQTQSIEAFAGAWADDSEDLEELLEEL